MKHHILTNPNIKALNEAIKEWEKLKWKCQGGLVYGLVGEVSAYSVLLVKTARTGVKSPRFVVPSIEEVKEYIKEKKFGVNPDAFMAHQQKVGWKTTSGKKIESWKGAIKTWQYRSLNSKQPLNMPQPKEFKTSKADDSKKISQSRIDELKQMSAADIYKATGQLTDEQESEEVPDE